jgi:hypothetical protein
MNALGIAVTLGRFARGGEIEESRPLGGVDGDMRGQGALADPALAQSQSDRRSSGHSPAENSASLRSSWLVNSKDAGSALRARPSA